MSLGVFAQGSNGGVNVNGATNLATGLTGASLTTYNYTFTATTTLTLTAKGGTISQVDNVLVNATPEPSALAVLGLGTIAVLRRRRRA